MAKSAYLPHNRPFLPGRSYSYPPPGPTIKVNSPQVEQQRQAAIAAAAAAGRPVGPQSSLVDAQQAAAGTIASPKSNDMQALEDARHGIVPKAWSDIFPRSKPASITPTMKDGVPTGGKTLTSPYGDGSSRRARPDESTELQGPGLEGQRVPSTPPVITPNGVYRDPVQNASGTSGPRSAQGNWNPDPTPKNPGSFDFNGTPGAGKDTNATASAGNNSSSTATPGWAGTGVPSGLASSATGGANPAAAGPGTSPGGASTPATSLTSPAQVNPSQSATTPGADGALGTVAQAPVNTAARSASVVSGDSEEA